MWNQFQAEREKLIKDKAKFELAQKKRMNERQENLRKQRMIYISRLLFVLPSLFLLLPALD